MDYITSKGVIVEVQGTHVTCICQRAGRCRSVSMLLLPQSSKIWQLIPRKLREKRGRSPKPNPSCWLTTKTKRFCDSLLLQLERAATRKNLLTNVNNVLTHTLLISRTVLLKKTYIISWQNNYFRILNNECITLSIKIPKGERCEENAMLW